MSQGSPQVLFEDAKAYLQTTNENGKSIYDMLIDIVSYLQDHKDAKEINLKKLVEQLSEDGFKYGERSGFDELWKLSKPNPESCNKAREIVEVLSKQQNVMKEEFSKRKKAIEELNVKKDGDDDNQDDPVEENPDIMYLYSNEDGVSNLIEDFYALELVGVGLPHEEIAKLSVAIQNLKSSKSLRYLRFVGKILGIESHYYVVESNYYFKEKVPQDKIHESGGKAGLNRFTYWVLRSKDSLTNFVNLPDVTPQQINAARNISKLFTGNLEKEIISYPPFPGNEANYLRAQIARIVHSTTIAPFDLFEEREVTEANDEDDDDSNEKKKKNEIKYKEVLPPPVKTKAFELKDPEGMKSLEHWVHLYPGILKSGFITKEPLPGDQEPADPEDDKDPEVPSFKLLQEDDGLKKCKEAGASPKKKSEDDDNDDDGENKEAKLSCWKVSFSNVRKQTCHHKSFKVVMLSSLRWQGAHTFYRNIGPICHFGNVYIGYGIKNTGIPYTPILPSKVVEDVKEPVDQVDPKPNDAKRMLQGLEPTSEDKPEDDNPNDDEDGGNDNDPEEEDDE
ncbi:hypothetical protein NAEGRDRAFT_49798 [Naegleria gruberi]|uniref:Radial spokehead-like protein n=1 Tax=Naegleria gruberi TaxID=5762 RepID=D2VID9_NAEGR|nr:uncharacterized protein NAEGRDRAFT_49798 [Naegleria gruberi]EFC43249.1 hypothetical protein NAEGRDRAFT_49798 [Naegleria gruberi]|eukprot:XP_002675993.1 hypothetical protein NAEGRDRAFT_49798 [Naegleria gruberi strain NEG-M]